MGGEGGARPKREAVKEIIRELHRGLPVEAAKEKFEKEVGSISTPEIAEIEQSLIDEGLSPEEIKRFCNVHVLLFQSALQKSAVQEQSPAHPVYLFQLENREIEKITGALQEAARRAEAGEPQGAEIKALLARLSGIEIHYTRKEQLLFPFLEKQGFLGPSKVMWGKDNEIRDLLKRCLAEIDPAASGEKWKAYVRDPLNPLIKEVEGMIFKEENILFPTALEKLGLDDWVAILEESPAVGYAFIAAPEETDHLVQALKGAVISEPAVKGEVLSLPTGELRPQELRGILDGLPVDITFIDRDDGVKYFSENPDRIFLRTRSVLGRKVQNCHPPQSVDTVERILKAFKEGKRETAEFWIPFQGRLVHIRYFAVRDRQKRYLGTLEVTQDITGIQRITGEKRLLDEVF